MIVRNYGNRRHRQSRPNLSLNHRRLSRRNRKIKTSG